MKILFYTDTHFGESGSFSYPTASGYTSRLDTTLALHSWLGDVLDDRRPDVVINGGDLYKSQGVIEAKALSACTLAMTQLIERGRSAGIKQHYILLGNHDFVTKNHLVTSIDWLDAIPGCKLVRFLSEEDGLVLCPYYHTTEEVWDDLQAMASTSKVYFGHMSLSGVFDGMNRTPREYVGLPAHESGLSTSWLSQNFKMSFNGHHHVPQRPYENVLLPGSLQQFTVSEVDYLPSMKRGVWLLDTDTLKLTFIENRISPRIVKVFFYDELRSLDDNCCVVFHHVSEKDDKSLIEKELKRFTGSQYVSPRVRATVADNEKAKALMQETSSPEELYSTYIEELKLESEDLKSALLAEGVSIIQKAKAQLA